MQHVLYLQVLRSMRSGVSFEGKQAMAICLDDIGEHLQHDCNLIRQSVKENGLGKHNVAKDFVPTDSTNCKIRRGSNSHSRKCTIIWLETLPIDLQEKVLQGN